MGTNEAPRDRIKELEIEAGVRAALLPLPTEALASSALGERPTAQPSQSAKGRVKTALGSPEVRPWGKLATELSDLSLQVLFCRPGS